MCTGACWTRYRSLPIGAPMRNQLKYNRNNKGVSYMFNHKIFARYASRSIRAAALITVLSFASLMQPVTAQQVTMETLLDRIQVEDLLTRYYYDLSQGNAHELSEYFTEDALLDVDGTIAKGHDEIKKLYTPAAPAADAQPAEPRGRMHMLLTNPIIEIKGNTATAHVLWTGIMNYGIGKLPNVAEQGREDTELVKQDGKWRIKRRYITADGRMPNRFDTNYTPRENPLK